MNHVYYAVPVGKFIARTDPRNRLQVTGPGDRIELDFLTSPVAADRISLQMNLRACEAQRRLGLPNNLILPPGVVTIDQALDEHEAAKRQKRLPFARASV